MRITDQGQSFTSGQENKGSGRQRAFRAAYRVGDLLLGTVVDYLTPTMAWVAIGEIRVLAELTTTYPQGSEIYLIVTALYPEIILQEADQDAKNRAKGLHLIV
jgi:hypothetical protein